MNKNNEDKVISCERCGKEILEKCAIEENGQLLCGDCILLGTNREVRQAEKQAAELREQEYEQAQREVIQKQRKRTVLMMIVSLLLFVGLVMFNSFNRPEPAKSIKVNLEQNIETSQGLFLLAINKYQTAHSGSVPAKLDDLFPQYAPLPLKNTIDLFVYEKTGSTTYSLEQKSLESQKE